MQVYHGGKPYTPLNAQAVSPKPPHVTGWFDFLMAQGASRVP